MFTVQKGRVLVVSKGIDDGGGRKNEALTDEQVAMYIRPMQSAIIAGTDNSEDRATGMERSKLIAKHARMILDGASQKVVSVQGKQKKTILSILQGAFGPHIAGWTVLGDDMKAVKKFANTMLDEIQFPRETTNKTAIAANDPKMQIRA